MYPDSASLNYESDSTVAFFSLPHEVFNNWSAHQVKIYGERFTTAEAAFQYAKFKTSAPDIAQQIHDAGSPWEVFQIARANREQRDENWDEIKVAVMREIIEVKVSQHEDVKTVLLSTGDKRIIENSPWDGFWGAGSKGDGQNQLGKIYMQIRESLRR